MVEGYPRETCSGPVTFYDLKGLEFEADVKSAIATRDLLTLLLISGKRRRGSSSYPSTTLRVVPLPIEDDGEEP